MRSVVCTRARRRWQFDCVCSAWFKLNKMARNRHVANDMALDKLALPAISDADVLDILRTWDFHSSKERAMYFQREGRMIVAFCHHC